MSLCMFGINLSYSFYINNIISYIDLKINQ